MAEKRKLTARELAGWLRYCAGPDSCGECPYHGVPGSCSSELMRDAAAAIEENAWIDAAVALPAVGEAVIVCRGDKVEQGRYLGVNGWWKVYGTNTKAVTHWRPMPKGPEVAK